MSASTERKNRIAAKSDGTHKKTIAAQKEAEKQRKDKIKWSVVGAIIFVFVVAVIYLNTGIFYRNTTAVSIDIEEYETDTVSIPAQTVDFSIAQVNYVFRTGYNDFVNQYGSMAMYIGLDTSKSLKSQPCSFSMTAEEGEDEDYTWYDYFMDQAVSQLQQFAILKAYADAAGIELTKEDNIAIEQSVNAFVESAKAAGASLSQYYGKGFNEDVLRSVLELGYLADEVSSSIAASKDFSAEEITAHYTEIADDYDYYSYSFYLVEAETGVAEDGMTPVPATDEAMAAAEEAANKIMRAVRAGDLEGAVIAVMGEDVVPQHDEAVEGVAEEGHVHTASTAAEHIQGINLEPALAEWLKSENRQDGDIEVVKADGVGFYVVLFSERHTETDVTSESGDAPYCDYISEQSLRDNLVSEWNTNIFNAILKDSTADQKFGARYISAM